MSQPRPRKTTWDTTRFRLAARRRLATPGYRERHSAAMKKAVNKRNKNPAYREKLSIAARKWCQGNPEKVHVRHQKWIQTIQRIGRSQQARRKQSLTMKRLWADPRIAKMYLSTIGTNHHPEYLDRRGRLWVFKSTWELKFAEFLDQEKLTWFYEPCVLLLSDGSRYFPDFWVEELKTYVELKASHRDARKAKLAKQDGHQIKLLRGWRSLKTVLKA